MKDTFGLALMAFFDDPTSTHIIERDDGYINLIETSSYFRPFDKWHPIEQKLAKLAQGKILDVGCGNGRVMKYFQKQGLEAVGIDISKIAIEASKKFGATNCLLMDARKLDLPENSFDTASLLGNGLGLSNVEESRNILSNLSKVVKPNGLLIASSRDPKNTDNPRHIEYHNRNRELGKPIGLVHLRVIFNGLKGEWFDFFMVEPEKVNDLIEGTGWRLKRIIKDDNPLVAIYGVVLKNKTYK
jgi:SAM-dependent methyltransferase